MIGTKGTLKHIRTHIHNVPLVFCPVCHRVEVHHLVANEYEILAEYARGDDAPEIDFEEYVETKEFDKMFENCVNYDNQEPLEVVQGQIDNALDLLLFAKQMKDKAWEKQLIQRLGVLSSRRTKLKNKKALKP